jgi:predicted ArsR family transcriptional regulator
MTQAERDRLVALQKAKKKLITQKQAAEEIGVTERQVRRLLHKLHEITVSKETLRGWMVEAGLWKAGRRRVVEAHP